jgi:hypothetical protein
VAETTFRPIPESAGGIPQSPLPAGARPSKRTSADGMPMSGLSVPQQDLSGDKLLLSAPRVSAGGNAVPALGGIPLWAKLGQGGMGAVYLGFHLRLHKEVAVKVLPFHLAEQQPELIDRFYREAQIAARVQSPHLVGVLDVNEDGGLFYIVMEFVRGVSAGGCLKQLKLAGRAGFDEATALDICIATATGLAAAHAEGIIHRDLKPDNILIPKGGPGDDLLYAAAKLADLGLARVDILGQTVTKSDAAMGTPGYMPPEQGMSAKKAGKPADVFAVGATLYAMLGGRAPFQGESSMEILLHTMQQPHTPIQQLVPAVSAATAALIDRCLAKQPQGRYVDASALREALKICRAALGETGVTQEKALEQMTVLQKAVEVGRPVAIDTSPPPAAPSPVPAMAPSAAMAATLLGKPRTPETAERPRTPETAERPRTAKALAAVLALGLLGGGGFLFWQWRESEFRGALGEAVGGARAGLTAEENGVAQALAALEDFKRAHASRGPSDLAPATELGVQLTARRDKLTKRKADFGSALAEAQRLCPANPQAALSRLEDAERVGKADTGEALPDLLAGLEPGLEKRKAEARAAAAKQGFEANYEAGKELAGRGDWGLAERSLSKALDALAENDHPAKPAVVSLLASARAELKKRADFAAKMKEADAHLAAQRFPEARLAYDEAKRVWPESPDASKAQAGIATALAGASEARYAKAIEEGHAARTARKWPEAEAAFSRALEEKAGDPVASKGVAEAQAGAGEERYTKAMQRGRNLLASKSWAEAEQAFTNALAEKPGDVPASKGQGEAQAGGAGERCAKTLKEGKAALASKEWRTAQAASMRALIEKPGDVEAQQLGAEARYGAAMDEGRAALAQQGWKVAVEAFNRAQQEKRGDQPAGQGITDARYGEALQQARRVLDAGGPREEDWNRAVSALKTALAEKPGDEAAAKELRRAENGLNEARSASSLSRARQLAAMAQTVADWQAVSRACQEALGLQRSDEAAALARRAADAIATLSVPTLSFEPRDQTVFGVELDNVRIDKAPPRPTGGLFAKQAHHAVGAFNATVTPGAHTVKILFFGGYYKKSASFTAVGGKAYRITGWVEANPFNQLFIEVYEDGKLIVEVRNASTD